MVPTPSISLRRLAPADAATYRQLRLRALRESPTAFGSSHAEEVKFPLQTYASRLEPAPSKWTFGAYEGERLVGIVTLVREERRKERHKAWIFGLYVAANRRGQGVGRQLLERTLQSARGMRGLRQVKLAVVASNVAAVRLYESLGFQVYGREEDALQVAGQFHAELYLVCPL